MKSPQVVSVSPLWFPGHRILRRCHAPCTFDSLCAFFIRASLAFILVTIVVVIRSLGFYAKTYHTSISFIFFRPLISAIHPYLLRSSVYIIDSPLHTHVLFMLLRIRSFATFLFSASHYASRLVSFFLRLS